MHAVIRYQLFQLLVDLLVLDNFKSVVPSSRAEEASRRKPTAEQVSWRRRPGRQRQRSSLSVLIVCIFVCVTSNYQLNFHCSTSHSLSLCIQHTSDSRKIRILTSLSARKLHLGLFHCPPSLLRNFPVPANASGKPANFGKPPATSK